MKIGLMVLPFLCVASVAMAAGEDEKPVRSLPGATAPGMAPTHYRMVNGKKKPLPGGDLRSCLDMKTDAEIIRCSETRRKK